MAKKSPKAQKEQLFKETLVPGAAGSGKLFDVNYEVNNSKTVECLGMKFPSDEARQVYFIEKLREKLKDSEFRKIEGFPLGEIENVLSLSDPPYYTACPNPWLSEFIERNGTKYDPEQQYHREPFAADVSEGKKHLIYNAHSYHTKVPHRAIMRYILHYTQPDDLVFDGFCGTGMTGVAALLCGDIEEVQELGYRVEKDGTILDEEGTPFSKLGARRAVLNDLSPAATFISYNYNTPVNSADFEREAARILNAVRQAPGWMYVTLHGATEQEVNLAAKALMGCRSHGECQELLKSPEVLKKRLGNPSSRLTFGHCNYNVWSDVFICPECNGEINFVKEALDLNTKRVKETLHCPHCHAMLSKRQMDRVQELHYDLTLKTTNSRAKQELSLVNYRVGNANYEKAPDAFDNALSARTSELLPQDRYPDLRMPEGDEARRNDAIGLTHVHHFYRPRALCVLSDAYALAQNSPQGLRRYLVFAVEQAVLGMSKIARYAPTHYSQVNQYLSGTLYVGSQVVDVSIDYILEGKIKNLTKLLNRIWLQRNCLIDTRSSSAFDEVQENVFDYIFVDPPFGGNLTYSSLNFFWEAWLGVITNSESEAITNMLVGKGLREYHTLMQSCFKQFYRLLKPGRWITIEFSNTQASVWNTIQTTLQEAGFVVANVSALDKQQGSFKAVTTTTAVKQDLVISAYKPNGGFEERFLNEAKSEEGVWDFVRTHLRYLPVTKRKNGLMQIVPERDARILFDQVVSYYVRNGYPVPISSHDFQAGLVLRFSEREGMFFLQEQVSEYDAFRMTVQSLDQHDLFVSDERSAIQWVRRQLLESPMKYQDLSPQYMKEAQRVWEKHEQPVELRTILEQNFVVDTDGVWHVPDIKNEAHLEQIRNRTLLKEFQQYMDFKGKLKTVRTEALRAGFKEAWQHKDYVTIVQMGKRLPDAVIQEDSALLMYFDNASLLLGD
jgi:DNA modification methylase